MTFARPEYARKSWDAIKAAKPKTLYFYSNKGRKEKEGEIEHNNEIRAYIDEIDWDCNLHTWFREEYVDIYTSLLGAKNWAFEHEETLIMLEEDTCASLAFFEFCDHFLKVYKSENKINFVTGDNYAKEYDAGNRDHIICHSIHHHGWATWKDRWEQIDWQINPQAITKGFKEIYYFGDIWLGLYYKFLHKDVTPFIERTRCWDYVKVLNQINNNQLAVVPIYNLVQNIGVDGVHIKNGEGVAFELSNNDERGKYPFTGVVQKILDDRKFDIAESTVEGYRNKKQIWNRLKREYIINIFNKLRVRIGLRTRIKRIINSFSQHE